MSTSAKILIAVGILAGVVISVGVYLRMSMPTKDNPASAAVVSDPLTTSQQPLTDVAKYDFIRASLIQALEASMAAVNKRIDDLAKKQTTNTTGVTALTTTTVPVTPAASTTSAIKTLYIPLGYGGSSTRTTDFESIGATEIAINPSNYPGYKQMVFEANMRIFQGNGKGEARIFNKTDGTAILNSLVSTTSQDYSTQTSGGFTLPGNKTYVVQLKSSTGYAVDLQLTRLRIDF